jgi:RNA polymerase sigma-70 factor (ECF subfamily)
VGRPEGRLPINARDPRDELPEHLNALRAFAISLTRNVAAADDLVQDTIVKAWTNLDKFQPGSNLRAWLFTILRNTFYSDKRKTRREVPDPRASTPRAWPRSRPMTGAWRLRTSVVPSTG